VTPVPPFNLDSKEQHEYIMKFLQPDSDSTTLSVPDGDQVQQLDSMLRQISEIMLEEHESEDYETLILHRFEQDTIIKVLYYEDNQYHVMTFYLVLDQ